MIRIVNQPDIDRLIRVDEVFAFIQNKYGSPPNWTRPPGFISLSRIILEQQVSLASANAHFRKLQSYVEAFSPSHILQLSDEEMRGCQISRQKTKYLRALSTAILKNDLDLEEFSILEEAEIRAKLTPIKGIGEWTIDIYLMFCLQAKDIFPIGDNAVVRSVRELYHVDSKEDIFRIAEKWKPLRSLAAYFLWHYYLRKRNRPSG